MKNKKEKLLLVLIGILILLLLLVFKLYKKHQTLVMYNNYEQKVLNYLYDTYHRKFKLKYIGQQNKKNFGHGVFNGLSYSDKTTIGYTFKVYYDDIKDKIYATLWYDKNNKEILIEEVNSFILNNSGSGYADTSYKLYMDKEIVSKKINEISKNYNDLDVKYDYQSSYYYGDYFIHLKFNHSYSEEIKNNFKNMEQLIETLKKIDKNIYLYMDFTDYNNNFTKFTIIEDEKNISQLMNLVYKRLTDDFSSLYKIEKYETESHILEVTINSTIKEKYKNENSSKYDDFYSYLYDLSVNFNKTILVNFKDYEFWINKNHPNNLNDYFLTVNN